MLIIQLAYSIFGIIGGPYLGIFLLGTLASWTNWKVTLVLVEQPYLSLLIMSKNFIFFAFFSVCLWNLKPVGKTSHDVYLESYQISKKKLFEKVPNGFQSLVGITRSTLKLETYLDSSRTSAVNYFCKKELHYRFSIGL